MSLRHSTVRVVVALIAVIGASGCAVLRPSAPDVSDRGEQADLERLAHAALGVKGEGAPSGGTENMIGLRAGSVTFSRRLDSRTYFAHDDRYGLGKAGGTFEGADDEIVRRARHVLDSLRIPGREVDRAVVRREHTQEAEVTPGGVVLGRPGAGHAYAWVTRRIEGLPVFSSRAVVGLRRSGDVGFMEVHWPEIPTAVVTEARRLDFRVRQGWRPPEIPGAKVESVQAGVLHSPAAGFLMDVHPVIRVVYAPTAGPGGKRPVVYYNRDGKPAPAPRQFALPCAKELAPRAPSSR
jgi:hypothetical protein